MVARWWSKGERCMELEPACTWCTVYLSFMFPASNDILYDHVLFFCFFVLCSLFFRTLHLSSMITNSVTF